MNEMKWEDLDNWQQRTLTHLHSLGNFSEAASWPRWSGYRGVEWFETLREAGYIVEAVGFPNMWLLTDAGRALVESAATPAAEEPQLSLTEAFGQLNALVGEHLPDVAAGETAENVFGEGVDESLMRQTTDDFANELTVEQLQAEIEHLQAERLQLLGSIVLLEGERDDANQRVDDLTDAVNTALHALGVDPSDWSEGLIGIKAAIAGNLQIVIQGTYKTRDDWCDVPAGTITDALFELVELWQQAEAERDAAKKALKPFAELVEVDEADGRRFVAAPYVYMKEQLFAAADALKE